MFAERGMVLADPAYGLADRAGHTCSGALGRGRGSSMTAAEAERAGELANEELAFGVGLCGPLGVPDGAGLVEVVVDLGEASAVGVLGAWVEDLAGVAEQRARRGGRRAGVDLATWAGFCGDQVQHVVLPAGVGEEPREVVHALEVTDVHGVPVEDQRPVVPLAVKHVAAGGRLLDRIVVLDVRRWGRWRRGGDP